MANRAGIPVWREMGAAPHPANVQERQRVVIVGAGPVGLTLALDLGQRGHDVVVLSRLDFIAGGSKAICFSKRTLDIWDRLGVGDAMVHKGVVWNIGKVFRGDNVEPIYQFDLLPVKDQRRPAFINIQQYHVEERLVDALADLPCVDLRWGHEVVDIVPEASGARLWARTSEGSYCIHADWVIACDGSRSTVRESLGLDFEGRVFEDNFLIADVKMEQARPSERWFWFDPPFNRGQSALLHKQPDDVWRLDFQLGWNIDREACVRPENVAPYVERLLGKGVSFSPEWYSVYTFQCRRMARFVHGRIIFAGDSAHLVSPFGARGCNGGVADADNLAWKLDLVLNGTAPESLIETYNAEAVATADENILNSTRSTDFITPKSAVSRGFRDAVLDLAEHHAFARPFVNSGRLSTAVHYPTSELSTPDEPDSVWRGIAPGAPALDAPLDDGWLLERLGTKFVLLANGWSDLLPGGVTLVDLAALGDAAVTAIERFDLQPGSAYLIRPDHYIAARWRAGNGAMVAAALARSSGRG